MAAAAAAAAAAPAAAAPAAPAAGVPLPPAVLERMMTMVWGPLAGDDVERWYRQELSFSTLEATRFGLKYVWAGRGRR